MSPHLPLSRSARLLLFAVSAFCSLSAQPTVPTASTKAVAVTGNDTYVLKYPTAAQFATANALPTLGSGGTFLSGSTVTFASGSTLAVNGVVSGTPTSGTLNLSNLTLTLGTVPVTDVTFGASGPGAKSSISARAPRPAMVFDGHPSEWIGITNAFGAPTITPIGSADYSLQYIFTRTANSAQFAWLVSGANAPAIVLNNSGQSIGIYNLTNSYQYANYSIPSNEAVNVTYTRSGNTGTFYVNGKAVGSTVTDSHNYTGTRLQIGGTGTAGYSAIGTLHGLNIWNRCMSAAEVKMVAEQGVPLWQDYNSAGATVTAGSFVYGKKYKIASAGTTDFTAIGAANSTEGTEFTATGAGTGTGTATSLGLLMGLDPNQVAIGTQWRDLSGNNAHLDTSYVSAHAYWARANSGAPSAVSTLTVGGGSTLDLIKAAAASLDFPSVAGQGGTQDLTITLTGASVGDSVIVTETGATMADSGLVVRALVTSANTVTVRATNTTALAIDPAATSFTVLVFSR
jgi:hypothetical protein